MNPANETPAPAGPETHVQTAPSPAPAADAAVSAKKVTKPFFTPERLAEEIRHLDRLLVVVVVALAFLLGSFMASNADVWQHLASGRLLAHGDYRFGHDPFSYTTDGVRWVNHSWLWDLGMYWASGAGDGPELAWQGAPLVIFKAIMVAVTAMVLLAIRRRELGFWLPAVCTAVAVLALSPRLFLQPTTLSFLFLAVTLWQLTRLTDHEQSGLSPRLPGAIWILPIVFVIWVNVDSWFVLGPLTVGLYLLGRWLQGRILPLEEDPVPPGELKSLAIVLVAGLVACLLNPHHVFAFALPPELAVLTSPELRQHPPYLAYLSPFAFSARYFSMAEFSTPAGLAYYVLVGLGVASFGLNWKGLSAWRLLIWLTFFGLSACLLRLVPFFAVVAGPITALNLQEFAARCFGVAPRTEPGWKWLSLGGRIATILAVVGLGVLAWPGWLHAHSDDAQRTRRVAWQVNVDPATRKTAETLAGLREAWRRQGIKDEEARGFYLQPELGYYCAWFAPGEKSFYDHRVSLFQDAAVPYVEIREPFDRLSGLAKSEGSKSEPDLTRWLEPLQKQAVAYRINHVVVPTALAGRRAVIGALALPTALWRDAQHWELLATNGRLSIFGWKGTEATSDPGPFRELRFNANRPAFGKDLPADSRSPEEGPAPPAPRGPWVDFALGPVSQAPELDESVLYRVYHYDYSSLWRDPAAATYHLGLVSGAAGDCSLGGAVNGAVQAMLTVPGERSSVASMLNIAFIRNQETSPAAPLLLALRAARRAVAASPDDPDSYLALAQCYNLLQRDQFADTFNPIPLLVKLRQIQIITALYHAALLKPDAPEPHRLLAEMYLQLKLDNPSLPTSNTHLDLGRDELKKWLDAYVAAGPAKGQEEDFRKGKQQIEERLQRLEKQLKTQMDNFELESAQLKRPVERANKALEKGLAQEALNSLPDIAKEEAREDEAMAVVSLKVLSGRTGEVLNVDRGVTEVSRLFMDAALGNYRNTDQILAHMIEVRETDNTRRFLNLLRGQNFQTVLKEDSMNEYNQLVAAQADVADLLVIRGLLALEAGDTQAAAAQFRRALSSERPRNQWLLGVLPLAGPSVLEQLVIIGALPDARVQFRFDFSGRPMAERYLRYLEAQGN